MSHRTRNRIHHLCRCPVYYEIRGRFHCLFKEGFWPLARVMNFEDQRCLGLFLLELRKHREDLLKKPDNERHIQREITDFFKTQTRSTTQDSEQALEATSTSNTRGILINRAYDLGKSKRTRSRKRAKHRWRIHQRVAGHSNTARGTSDLRCRVSRASLPFVLLFFF